jgi:alpha-beta hydrolase superfamily lysophospholipase
MKMYADGKEWSEENAEYKKDVHIVHDGLNLYGEYYDFGYDRCVMVLSGRTESLTYGYYFAIPYSKNGCNVLVVDPRAHGFSDGKYNTVGHEESGDAIAWVEHIRDTFGVRSFVFHGICIGSAGGMLALAKDGCPSEIDGIVAEGMFANFNESVKNHMIEKKRPRVLTLRLVDAWMKHYTGHSMRRGPIDVIQNVNVPLLMLHSKEDLYSTPENAQRLYDKSGSKNKRMVWFEHGKHSMLRITDTERYDTAISEFLAEIPAFKKI